MINPNITANNFQNMFLSYFYGPLIDKFTRVDEKRGTSRYWTIFTPMLLIPQVTLKVDSLKLRSLISDHYSIFCITDLAIKMKTTSFMKKRHFNNKNKSIYKKR